MKHRHALVACARWEEQHVEEWIEHHRSVGFDHIYLYSNDDDPSALLRTVSRHLYGPDPFLTFRHWPKIGEQPEIYFHFLRSFKAETEWFAFLDIDEFFVFKRADGVAAFMDEFRDNADCVYFNWLNHGNNGKVRRDDAPVLTSHLRRSRKPDVRTKMICRSAAVGADAVLAGYRDGRGAFWHFLDNYRIDGLRCVNVLHQPMDGYSADFPHAAEPFLASAATCDELLAKAYVAHFQFKSEEDFMRRHRRGGFHDAGIWKEAYENGAYRKFLDDGNAVYDTHLARRWHAYANAGSPTSLRVPPETLKLPNVALNKPSWQSSVYEAEGSEPRAARVSGGGNNGVRTGTYGFHTKLQDDPWWIVDLLGSFRIAGVRVYNRIDDPGVAARASRLDVMVSLDASRWTAVYARDAPFGGIDGSPLAIRLQQPVAASFVLVRLRGRQFLHLDEIEVYGEPV